MKTLSIGITTFKNRLNDVSKQIKEIRAIDQKIKIILAITNNYGETMDEEYRKSILNLCIEYPYVYPLMFGKYTGLAKMWNNIVVHSQTTHVLIMNDDLCINNPMIFNDLRIAIQTNEALEINGIFSHFIVSKELMNEVGYFDERLIAYGEEDGDFRDRYLLAKGHPISHIRIGGIMNQSKNKFKDSYDTAMDCHQDAWGGYKPTVNVEVIKKKKAENWDDVKQYPYEEFIDKNYSNIGKFQKIEITN